MIKKILLPYFNFVFTDTANTIAADVEAAAFIPEVWAQRALGRLKSACPMIGCVTKDYEDEIASLGDTVNVQKRGTLSTNDKTPNTSVTLQNPTATTIQVVLDNHKEVSFLVEDVAEAQANTDVLDGYIADGCKAIAEDIEAALTGQYANVAAGNIITWDNSDSDAIRTTIATARTGLVVTGKCGNQPRYLIIRDMMELLDCEDFTSADKISNQNFIEEGSIGTILGFNVKESGECQYTVSPTQTHRLAFAKEGIALVTRRLPNPPADTGVKSATMVEDNVALRVLYGYNMNYLGMQSTIDILFGTKILRSEWVYCIEE